MDLWRLQVRRKLGVDEIIDLHRTPKVFAGDDSSNNVSIASTAIPNKLKLLEMKRNFPVLRLTEETIGTLKGSYETVSTWKERLYSGRVVRITGEATWQLENIEFRVYQTPRVALSAFKEQTDPLARKHFWQSVGTSTSSHLMIFLLLFLANLVVSLVEQTLDEELEVEKVTLAQVEDIFNEPEPEPEVKEAEKNQDPALAQAEEPQKDVSSGAVPVPPKKSLKKMAQRPRAAAKSNVKSEGRKVESMGLLAIQGAATSSSKNVNLKAPRSSTGEGSAAAARDFNPTGTGIHSGKQSYQVAQIDGFSAGSYQSGQLGKRVAAQTGPAVRLVRKEIEIRGGLDKGIVRSIVEERLPELQYCYENALLKDQAYGGKMMAAWTIQPDGSVAKLSSSSNDMQGNEFHSCIRARIAKWKFPSPKGGGVVDVKYPFVFSSLGG